MGTLLHFIALANLDFGTHVILITIIGFGYYFVKWVFAPDPDDAEK